MLILAYFIIYLIVFLYGISIGSFLNVLVYRIPLGIPISKGRSYCPKCKVQIKNYDLIPILSYVILRGKCRSCRDKISIRYPLVELLTGIVSIITFYVYDFRIEFIVVFAIASILITISLIDIDSMIIPDRLIISIIPLAIVLSFFQKDISIIERIVGFFVISSPMVLLNNFIKDSFGGGDIKLIAVCGAMLGWEKIILATFIGIIISGTYAIYLLISKKSKMGTHIAFGPYLCFGIYISLLFGNAIIRSYLGFFGL